MLARCWMTNVAISMAAPTGLKVIAHGNAMGSENGILSPERTAFVELRFFQSMPNLD